MANQNVARVRVVRPFYAQSRVWPPGSVIEVDRLLAAELVNGGKAARVAIDAELHDAADDAPKGRPAKPVA